MIEPKYKLNKLFGYVQLEQKIRYENGCIIIGHKRTNYDRNGVLVSDNESDDLRSIPLSIKEALSYGVMDIR